MTRDELVSMFEAGDLQALLLAVGRAWISRYFPSSDHATFVVDHGNGKMASMLVISSSSPPPNSVFEQTA